MKLIPLTQGKFAKVDDEDYEWLTQWNWYFEKRGYAGRRSGNKILKMHREIIKTPDGLFTDHINGDRIDNQKSNLRICTIMQNTHNSRVRKDNLSGYKGVSWCKRERKYHVRIYCNYIKKSIGYFDDVIEAALAYDKEARKLYGEFARTNF